MPAKMISSGVMSEPPPMPVKPTRMPTPRPKTMTSGSTASARVEAALGLARARPAPVATRAGPGAVDAADRGEAVVVERVVRQPALEDVGPELLLGPVRERVRL